MGNRDGRGTRRGAKDLKVSGEEKEDAVAARERGKRTRGKSLSIWRREAMFQQRSAQPVLSSEGGRG